MEGRRGNDRPAQSLCAARALTVGSKTKAEKETALYEYSHVRTSTVWRMGRDVPSFLPPLVHGLADKPPPATLLSLHPSFLFLLPKWLVVVECSLI